MFCCKTQGQYQAMASWAPCTQRACTLYLFRLHIHVRLEFSAHPWMEAMQIVLFAHVHFAPEDFQTAYVFSNLIWDSGRRAGHSGAINAGIG